mmetsp:Transcript_7965/g.26073  ORF Transcript_7965/g.26073 Transcript_7965/m.26073 type:complete len:401 (+) Transcript_7965:135-1337(+)
MSNRDASFVEKGHFRGGVRPAPQVVGVEVEVAVIDAQIVQAHAAKHDVRHLEKGALERAPEDAPPADEDAESALDVDAELGEVEVVAVGVDADGGQLAGDGREQRVRQRVGCVADEEETGRQHLLEHPLAERRASERERIGGRAGHVNVGEREASRGVAHRLDVQGKHVLPRAEETPRVPVLRKPGLPDLDEEAVDGADAALEDLVRRLGAEAALELPQALHVVVLGERERVLGVDGVDDAREGLIHLGLGDVMQSMDVVHIPTREPPERDRQADLGVDGPCGRVARLPLVERFQHGPNVVQDLAEERVRDAVRRSKFSHRERADVLRPVEPLRPPILPGSTRRTAVGEDVRCDDAAPLHGDLAHRRGGAHRRYDGERHKHAEQSPHRGAAHFSRSEKNS